jgi:hypothetical protein
VGNRTKGKKVHYIPCVDAFKPIAEVVRRGKGWLSSPFFFVNTNGKTKLKPQSVAQKMTEAS